MQKRKRTITVIVVLLVIIGLGFYIINEQSHGAKNHRTTTKSQVTKVAKKKMDIQAISNGDFSSVAGTWKNADGDVVVIGNKGAKAWKVANGNFSKVQSVGNKTGNSYSIKVADGLLTEYIAADPIPADPVGAYTPMSFIPKGVKPSFIDQDDPTKDRVVISQGRPQKENIYYYDSSNTDVSFGSDSDSGSDQKKQTTSNQAKSQDTSKQDKVAAIQKFLTQKGYVYALDNVDGVHPGSQLDQMNIPDTGEVDREVLYFVDGHTARYGSTQSGGSAETATYTINDNTIVVTNNLGTEVYNAPYQYSNGQLTFGLIKNQVDGHTYAFSLTPEDDAKSILDQKTDQD